LTFTEEPHRMQTTATTPVAPGPLAVLALPGSVPVDAGAEVDAAAAFALALDQATDELKPERAAMADLLPGGVDDTAMAPPLAEPRLTAAPHAGQSLKADLAGQTLAAAAAETPHLSKAATADEAPPTSELHPDEPVADTTPDDDAPAAELLAFVASLPLPPPPGAAVAVAAAQAQARPAAARPDAAALSADAGAVAGAVAAAARARPAAAEGAAAKDAALPTPTASVAAQAASARKAEAPAPLPAATESRPARVEPTGGDWLQALAAQREAVNTPVRPGNDNALPLPALPGGVAGAPARPSDAAPPMQAEVHAELGSKDFAPALGAQLSVLVRNGIEHAQLKLNPAELGPIEVRISIDGPQAQVDFSAAQAHTRQALQEAVPALATALRESGLTLTGGGVFDQPRDSRGEASARDPHAARATAEHASDEGPAASLTPRLPRARGVLDLYA
jgi:flagellar hook-length control protein FliK